MTVSQGEIQVTWDTGALNSGTIAASGGTDTSDAMSFSATTFAASIQLKTVNTDATPVAGDTVDFYILYTNGDPDTAESTDEFDTAASGTFLATLDTFNDGVTVRKTVPIQAASKGFKIHAINNGADTQTCSAQVWEKKVA